MTSDIFKQLSLINVIIICRYSPVNICKLHARAHVGIFPLSIEY